MKVTVSRGEFAHAAVWVARTVETNPYQPVLAGIRLEADHTSDSGLLRLSATSPDNSSTATVAARVDVPGCVLVSGALLAAVARVLPDKPVDLGVDGSMVTIACGASRFQLPTLPVQDFPALPGLPELVGQIPGQVLAEGVGQVVPAAATDGALPAWTGVLVEVTDVGLRLVASDRFRLAVRDLPWQPVMSATAYNQPLLVPARALADLVKGMNPDAMVRVHAHPDSTVIGLADGTRQGTARLLATDKPLPYQRLLNAAGTGHAVVATTDLTEAVKRVSALAQAARSVDQLNLTVTGDHLDITLIDTQGSAAHETLPAATTATDPITLRFQARLLLPALAALGITWVRLDYSTPTDAVLLRPASSEGNPDADHHQVVMPIRPAA